MLDLDKSSMTKAIKKYKGRFSPKYRAFNILHNNIEEVVKQSTQIWKVIYRFTIEKATEQVPEEVGEEKDEQEVVEITKDVSIYCPSYSHIIFL